MSRPIRIDRELAFKKWVEFGKLAFVQSWLYENGVYNKRTGKPFSIAAISKAARRWVCLHAEEAREYYERFGWNPNDDDWNAWLIRTSIKVFHDHNLEYFEKVIEDNDLQDEYGYLLGSSGES